jgi:hypothetical protein
MLAQVVSTMLPEFNMVVTSKEEELGVELGGSCL